MHAASQQHPRNARQACIPCTCELPNCTPVTAELPLIRFALQYAGAPQGTCKRHRRRGRLDVKLLCTTLKHRRWQTAACATGCHCASRTVQPAACWICNEPSGYAGAAERPHRATEPSSFSTSTPFFRQRVASAMRRCSARWASTAARSPGARHSRGAPNEARAAHHASTNETWTTSGTDAVSSCLACHPSCGCSAGSEQRGLAGTRQHSPREAQRAPQASILTLPAHVARQRLRAQQPPGVHPHVGVLVPAQLRRKGLDYLPPLAHAVPLQPLRRQAPHAWSAARLPASNPTFERCLPMRPAPRACCPRLHLPARVLAAAPGARTGVFMEALRSTHLVERLPLRRAPLLLLLQPNDDVARLEKILHAACGACRVGGGNSARGAPLRVLLLCAKS